MKKGYIIFETGEVFTGEILGEASSEWGEIVFNTSMTGYQEIMSDPSYAGQIVVFSYPLIGNYGINEEDYESDKLFIRGIVTGEVCQAPNYFKQTKTLIDVINKFKIPCITNVDTRAIVKTIRKRGTVHAIISDDPEVNKPKQKMERLVDRVVTKSVNTYKGSGPHIVLLDFGFKKSILSYLLRLQCQVTVVPFTFSIEQIQKLSPDGVVISNGPGDPANLEGCLSKIKELTEMYPTFGICLGHQLIALAYGAKTEKLKFGHRGGNHPIKDLKTEKVYITSQNHSYVVKKDTINFKQFDVTFLHVNDRTIEGLSHKKLPIRTVQFHPEAHPGPQDTEYILADFIEWIKGNIGVYRYAIQ